MWRMLFSAPTWGSLNLQEQEAWRKVWTRSVRLLFPDDRWTAAPTLPDTASVCRAASMPGPAEALRAERLLHVARLVNSSQESLLALLQHEFQVAPLSWLRELRSDLTWAVHWGGVPADAESCFPEGLIQYVLDAPTTFRRLVRRPLLRAPILDTAHNPSPDTEACRCADCGLVFSNRASQSPSVCCPWPTGGGRWASGGVTCPSCLTRFWTRTRLTRHLQYGTRSCRQFLADHGMHVAVPTRADRATWAAEARSVQHLPSVRVTGPLLPLQRRPPSEVVIEALEIITCAADPDIALQNLAAFRPRSSFFLSPALHEALGGACEAEGISTTWLEA